MDPVSIRLFSKKEIGTSAGKRSNQLHLNFWMIIENSHPD
jgi:hypothetical protein